MLYKKNSEKVLSKELFKNPTSEYRCTPFWAWNCKLEQGLLNKEIDTMKEMGMGGFHMHSRTGMATPYLTEEFMDLVRGCVEKAKKENMLAWLYDEDRWPSGSAGGIITKDYRYRARNLCFTTKVRSDASDLNSALTEGKPYLISVYDVVLDKDGMLKSYEVVSEDSTVKGTKWFAYMCTAGNSHWYNDQSYVDTLSKEAIDKFIHVTHDAYAEAIGDEFDKTVPAMFTDEPQFSHKQTFNFATDTHDVSLPWTPDLPDSFSAKYNYDIISKLPELFWELPEGKISLARYHYHDHVCDRFTEAFADNCGSWCEEHGINMTGHMMEEPTLLSQTQALGEAMRSYRKFGLPGIDMLCNSIELSTAKQAQSAVHQYGREGMLSELYGVTDWDFDFRGHKFQGDWQAALGVTIRVPHLYWVSMEGEAKRDYPASIGYQSPWYKEYSYVEDHFARVNTAMTRGKPVVKVGVIHPIESYWLHFGPKFMTASIREQMENHFWSLIGWLLAGLIDFDFISESLLPEQIGDIKGTQFPVGVMNYDTIIVPELETMRRSTFDILKKYHAVGGHIIFVGSCPTLIDAVPSDEIKELYDVCEKVNYDRNSILSSLENDRLLDIRNTDGTLTSNLIYQMRRDNDCDWLFIAHLTQNKNIYVSYPQRIRISLKGEYTPILYDTLTGEVSELSYKTENGCTIIERTIYSSDSLLLKLLPQKKESLNLPILNLSQFAPAQTIRDKVSYKLSEPNVLLLDYAEYKLDEEENFRAEEEILILDNIIRSELGMASREDSIVQPWVFPPEVPTHSLTLRFTVNSEYEADDISLAIENAEKLKIKWNGKEVSPIVTGYFTDESIKTVKLPSLKFGQNELIVTMPFGRQTNTEWCYLLGDFNVRLEGCLKTVTAPTDKIAFQSVTTQGLPFYGGNIAYKTEVDVPEDCTLVIRSGAYKGAVIRVEMDGISVGYIAYEPYTITVPNVKAGKHEVTFNLNGNRFNCFGALHNADYTERWSGPNIWRTGNKKGKIDNISVEGGVYNNVYYPADKWCDEYRVRELGMLTSPSFFFVK